jgi:hypothetical protein
MSEAIVKSVHEQLAKIDSVAADRIAWVIEQIADGGHTVNAPGLPWAGQEALIVSAMEHFALERREAEELVELARLDLWHGNGAVSPGHVERRLLIARLNVIRRVILQAVQAPKKTVTYVFKRKRNPQTGEVTLIRIPKREQVREGFDVNAVRMLIDIEAMMAKLNDLDSTGNTELVAEIFKQLEKDANGDTREKVVTSLSQKVKNMDISKFTKAGRDVIEAAMQQEQRKKVKSKAVGEQHERQNGREASAPRGVSQGDRDADEAGGLEAAPDFGTGR